MIRILHVESTLNINAGMMSVIMNYYRRLDRTKIQFDFLYFGETPSNYLDEITALGGKCFYLGEPGFGREYQQKLRAFFCEHSGEYTAVHCHPIWGAAIVGHEARRSGIKHILSHSHSTRYSEKQLSAIRNRCMMPLIHHYTTDYVACSEAAARLFGRNKSVFILHNAVSVGDFAFNNEARQRLRQELGFSQDDLVIGHVGRFSVEKNHAFMLRTFAELHADMPNAKLLLVGDGVLRSEIETSAQELGLSGSVCFTGKRTDVPDVLCAMDVFWLPSLFEGVPVSVIEAQAAGLPCVLSDTITCEVNFGKCTYISLSAAARQWADAFSAQVLTEQERVSMGSAMCGSAYDMDGEAQRLADFYQKMTN